MPPANLSLIVLFGSLILVQVSDLHCQKIRMFHISESIATASNCQNSLLRLRSVHSVSSLNWLLSSFHYLTGGQYCLNICKDILVSTVLNRSIFGYFGQFCNQLLVIQQMLFTQRNIWYKNISDGPQRALYLKAQWFSQGLSSSQVSEIKASGFCITGL